MKVNLTKQHIKIDLIESTGIKTIIDSDLPWAIRAEDSTWSLVPGEHIHVRLFCVFYVKLYLSFRFLWKNQWNVGGKTF